MDRFPQSKKVCKCLHTMLLPGTLFKQDSHTVTRSELDWAERPEPFHLLFAEHECTGLCCEILNLL